MHNFHGRPGILTPQDIQSLGGLNNLQQGLQNFQNIQAAGGSSIHAASPLLTSTIDGQARPAAQGIQRPQQGYHQAANSLGMPNANNRAGGQMAQNGLTIPNIQSMPEMPNLQDIQGIPGIPGMPGFGEKFDSQAQCKKNV